MKPTNLEQMLTLHEGLRLKPYKCTAGKLTIGVGRNLEDVGITEDEAEFMLINDINRCEQEALKAFKWFTTLSDERKDVVVSLIFNVGLARFKAFKKTIKYIEAGEYAAASVEMLDSKWAKQVGKRATQLSTLMRTADYSEVFK